MKMRTEQDQIILEAHRVILREQMEKMTNYALSSIDYKAKNCNWTSAANSKRDENKNPALDQNPQLVQNIEMQKNLLVSKNVQILEDHSQAQNLQLLKNLPLHKSLPLQKNLQLQKNPQLQKNQLQKNQLQKNLQLLKDLQWQTPQSQNDLRSQKTLQLYRQFSFDNTPKSSIRRSTSSLDLDSPNFNMVYQNETFLNTYSSQKLKRKYFIIWKNFIQHSKSKFKRSDLEEFISNIENYKKQSKSSKNRTKSANVQKTEDLQKSDLNSENFQDNLCSQSSSQTQSRSTSKTEMTTRFLNIKRKSKTATTENFKNRYEAQKTIIEMQKLKLEDQEKLINALKLGQVHEDLNKSIENAKINIRDIFQSACNKVKCKVNPVLIVGSSEKSFDLELTMQKAPKFVQEMEKRAQERALKREVILERKRIIDEQKKRLKQQAIDEKRAQDEEERRRNLEVIKERRRKELEIEKRRRMNQMKFEQQWKTASLHHSNKLITKCFTGWVQVVIQVKIYEQECSEMYIKSLLRKGMKRWSLYVNQKHEEKCAISKRFFDRFLMKRTFCYWKMQVKYSKQLVQVADDFYDMRLEGRIFNYWYKYVCNQYIVEVKNIQLAENHLKRRLLFQYFHQWKFLPAVLQLEKAKEEKRKKWRNKVWEILPDFQPQT